MQPGEALAPLPAYSPPPLSKLVRPAVPDTSGTDGEEVAPTTGEYDVFISHATEDKSELPS